MSKDAIKGILRRGLRGLGLEVQRTKKANVEPQILKNILREAGVSIVLDVGANKGQFGDFVFERGFQGTLISFEAIPSVHKELMEHAKGRNSSWVIAPCAAIGGKRGRIEINIAGNSVSSSVLPMKDAHLVAAPESKYVCKETVALERLDELAARFLPSVGEVLLKVDTQGYELEVLKGATGLLPRVSAMQLELSLIPLYDGAPTFTEMFSFVESMGYELFNLVPVFWDARSGRLFQVDAFFTRANLRPTSAHRGI